MTSQTATKTWNNKSKNLLLVVTLRLISFSRSLPVSLFLPLSLSLAISFTLAKTNFWQIYALPLDDGDAFTMSSNLVPVSIRLQRVFLYSCLVDDAKLRQYLF